MPMLTIPEAAARLGIPTRTLYHWIRQRQVPYVERDGAIRLTEAQVRLLAALLATYGRSAVRDRLAFAAGAAT